jgi:hypothetical protein
VAGVDAETTFVTMEKFALSAPAGTVTVVGTVTGIVVRRNPLGSLVDKVMSAPPEGAGSLSCNTP